MVVEMRFNCVALVNVSGMDPVIKTEVDGDEDDGPSATPEEP